MIKKFYKVDKVYITAAVVNEISKTVLINKLPDWLEVIPTALVKMGSGLHPSLISTLDLIDKGLKQSAEGRVKEKVKGKRG